jgi:hypothetical protein
VHKTAGQLLDGMQSISLKPPGPVVYLYICMFGKFIEPPIYILKLYLLSFVHWAAIQKQTSKELSSIVVSGRGLY